MISRRLIIVIIAVVIVSAGVIYQFSRPVEGVDVKLMLVHGSDPQKITIELKCTGSQPAHIYRITGFGESMTGQPEEVTAGGINYTFAEDMVVPPGSEIRITFPSGGGDVIIEALSGERPTGGGASIMEGEFRPEWEGKYPVTIYSVAEIWTRAGNKYIHTVAFQSEEYVPS